MASNKKVERNLTFSVLARGVRNREPRLFLPVTTVSYREL